MIKRFNHLGDMQQHRDGDFVTYEDHAAEVARLNEQVRALAADNAGLKKFCEDAAFDADYESELLGERGGFSDGLSLIKTPSTDAVLNEVRAQGADGLAAELYRVANEHVVNGRSKKDVVQCRAAAKAAEDYAARIRSGEVQP